MGSIYLQDLGVDRHHLILLYNEIHTLPFSALGSHALLPSFHRSTQFVWFLMGSFPIISSHPLATLLEPEPLFLTNSVWMPCEVRQSVDVGVGVESKRERTKKLNCLSIQEKENTRLIYREKIMLGKAEYHNWSPKPSTSAGTRPPQHGSCKPLA